MVKLVFGTDSVGTGRIFSTLEATQTVLDAVARSGVVETLDTAQLYDDCEEFLGQVNAAAAFAIDTKDVGGLGPGPSTADQLVRRGKQSLKALRTSRVDVFYLHAPDRTTPLRDTLAGVDELHRDGAFIRFGLSNFTSSEVEEVIATAQANNFVLPSVYQGAYSAVMRQQETVMMPLLRRHKMAFYAYSPAAGGFLTKSKEEVLEGKGRWDRTTVVGQLHNRLYNKDSLLEALVEWGIIAEDAGISRAEMAYRWVAHNSALKEQYGDAVVIGASSVQQVETTIGFLKKGPLSDEVVQRIEAIWDLVKHESSLDYFNS